MKKTVLLVALGRYFLYFYFTKLNVAFKTIMIMASNIFVNIAVDA